MNITIGCTATNFTPLRGSQSAREPGVKGIDETRNTGHRKHRPLLRVLPPFSAGLECYANRAECSRNRCYSL